MKIAFLILNHREPPQLVRLLTALRSQLPDSPIVVHHDVFHNEIPSALIESIGNVHLLTSGKRVTWGDFSLVDVCSWSLRWMHENIEFDWIVLLSAQDYPIKPLANLADDLARNGADAVIGTTPISQLPLFKRMHMRRRYLYRYRPVSVNQPKWLPRRVPDLLHRIGGVAILALNNVQPLVKIYRLDGSSYRIGWRASNTPFDRNWPCWYGSQWFALSRRAFEYALDYMVDHPEHVNYYRGTLVPDESVLATIINNAPNLRVANGEVTYTRWANSTISHPDIFRTADFSVLAAAPQYFARKFDIDVDSGILDSLDEFMRQAVCQASGDKDAGTASAAYDQGMDAKGETEGS